MELLLPLLIQIFVGGVGGNAIPKLLGQKSMAMLQRIVAGAVGGVAGGTGATILLGAGSTVAGFDTNALLGSLIGGLVGGGAMSGVLGALMGKIR